ncbi:hypothetical protein Xen7305DRAFT_00046590 [Xenococcus sp. PCC 7305]|uniref:hypothetical protein n=1 Tax=Xenococcus sp. PCC 7305 TaxID=102125 RepID=UPI0002AC1AFD|nr:hypothetical protein [Xenococcus sp. PCC 7305]ELS04923.1 hypothetical protein Xen7305DRAFT_00046590 [Xenococcus sp. PCC 7305]
MPFENGYPIDDSIKPALYICDPQQTHDLVQFFIPDTLRPFLDPLVDERHYFLGLPNIENPYVIERYTEEDYSYAWEFSSKLYEFGKYLSSFRTLFPKNHPVAPDTNIAFGNRFENLSLIDFSLYQRDYADLVELTLPNSENSEDWVTITFYETVPWIYQELSTYTNPAHAIRVERVTTLLTKNDLIFYEIPDSRSDDILGGSYIPLEVENANQLHFIQILYTYPFLELSTEGCMADPSAKRFNLVNLKFQAKGQEIYLNTRWFVGYTMVVDSNNSVIKDQVEAQIPEHYLFSNFQGYLDSLKAEIEINFPSKKIISGFSLDINWNQSVSLSNYYGTKPNPNGSGLVSDINGNQSISVSYVPSPISYEVADINPDAHYEANILYGNNNLFNNLIGDTTENQDLGIGVTAQQYSENGFRLTNGNPRYFSASQISGLIHTRLNNKYNRVSTSGSASEGIIASTAIDSRDDFNLLSETDEFGNYSLTDDQATTEIRSYLSYRIREPLLLIANNYLFSDCQAPMKVAGDPRVTMVRNPEGGWMFEENLFLTKLQIKYFIDSGQAEGQHEYTGESYNPTGSFRPIGSESSSSIHYYSSDIEGYRPPQGSLYRAANIHFDEYVNSPITVSFSKTYDHIWTLEGKSTVRTTPQPRDLSSFENNLPTLITNFNQKYFEECSCMTQQIAQEILDLVREIHASLDSGKFAYQGDGETKRVANIGYYAERIARVLGISVAPDGSIRSIRQSKLIETGESLPAGWPLGQFGRNQGGSSVGQTGGSATEDRDGIAYAVRSNSFGVDEFTGEANSIKEGGYVLVENIPQLIHLILDDLDRAIGIQDAGANIVPSPNGELVPVQGMNNLLLQLLYTAGQTNKSASKNHICSLITQAIVKEILQALGLPLTIKKLPIQVDEDKTAYLPIPGTNNQSPSLVDLIMLCQINIGALLEGKIDFNLEEETEEEEN